MIKLIASDIDGTLVQEGTHELNPELLDVILKLRAKGIQFAAASGRQWISIERLFDPIKEKIFYISDNGAYVGCHGRNLFLNTIERAEAMELIEAMKKIPGVEVMVGSADTAYMDTKDQELLDWMINGYKFRIQQVEDVREITDDIIKVTAYRKSAIEESTRELCKQFGDRFKMSIAGDVWLDCMAKGVNKGAAIRVMQEELGILPEETMAFGDQCNDIEMMKQAYYSFAVNNAKPEVKEAARFRADSNDQDGVLKILKLLL